MKTAEVKGEVKYTTSINFQSVTVTSSVTRTVEDTPEKIDEAQHETISCARKRALKAVTHMHKDLEYFSNLKNMLEK